MAAEAMGYLASLVKIPTSHFNKPGAIKSAMDSMFTYLVESQNLYEIALGHNHPQTADSQTKVALAYMETG